MIVFLFAFVVEGYARSILSIMYALIFVNNIEFCLTELIEKFENVLSIYIDSFRTCIT